jgi:hypothetical protein
MVRALLEGRKAQTRRLAWRSIADPADDKLTVSVATPWQRVQPGDRLWLREACMPAIDAGGADYRYAADYDAAGYRSMAALQKWRPSIHMPRWASRITLTVTDVRRQRLQDIDGIDALAEGITREEGVAPWRVFLRLWNELHGEGAWQSNPEVVALTFTVALHNIDQQRSAA